MAGQVAHTFPGTKHRHEREEEPDHLDWIRTLPCLVCGAQNRSEAAHIRMSDRRAGKRDTGKQEKPSDCWAVPLCAHCHRTAPVAQHSMGERDFWDSPMGGKAIDVVVVAAFLWRATGDQEQGEQIIRANR